MVHEHGFFHGELHAENILVGQNDYTFYLIDVGRIKFRKRLPEPWKIYDLARFFYSVLDICTNNEMAELIDNYASNTLTTKDKKSFTNRSLTKFIRLSVGSGMGGQKSV